MSRDPAVAALVAELVGMWSGEGEGQYPTIDSFRYRETTEFAQREDHPALRFEQRAWRQTPEGEVVSHWELGLLRISSDGSVLMRDAQGGRSEAMAGSWETDRDGWSMSLQSTGYAGDERVIASTRSFRLRPGELNYEMHMETIKTHQMSLHLRAILHKDVP